MHEGNDKHLVIDNILFYEGIYDFLKIKNKVRKLLSSIHLNEALYKIKKLISLILSY